MEEEDIDIWNYIEVVWRRKWLVFLLFLIVAIAAVVISLYQPPIYDAKTTILLEKKDSEISTLLERAGIVVNPLDIQTQAEIIKKRPTMEKAAILAGMRLEETSLLQDSITVSVIRNTNLIEIKARANNPDDAKIRANAVAEAFVEYLIEERNKDSAVLLKNIEEELKRAKDDPVEDATNNKMVEIAKTLELSKRLEVIIPAKVVEEATLPLKPGNLPLWMSVLLGIMLGLMSGIFGAFIVEYFDDNLNSVHDIKRLFKLPILGEIPFEIKNTSSIPDDKTKSHFSEAFSMLFTYLSFMSNGKPLKSIVVTSPGPNDGKTSVSIGLGEALALRGKRVLIIDADMRKAGLSKRYNLTDNKGLSSLLVSSDKADEYIFARDTSFILPSGILPPNPAELLYSPRMKQMLDEMSSQYDLIIIDTPPMLGFAEALTLAQLVDGVVVVARINNTRRNALQKAIEMFQGPNIKLFGLVVNGVKRGHKDDYYYYKY